MPKCPNCHKPIESLDHGVCGNLIFTAKLVKGKLDQGLVAGKPLSPHTFDSLSAWYSCPLCGGSIVDETQVKDKLGSGVDHAAERFLQGVEGYLEEEEDACQ